MVSAPVASARYSRWRETASLHERGDERRDHAATRPTTIRQDLPAAVVVVAAAAAAEEGHPQEDVGDEADRDDEPEDDHRDADVVVADVAELVRHDALELGVVHQGSSRPVVAATTACSGSRPVAKAFGAGSSTM